MMVKIIKTKREFEGRWTEEYVAVEEDTLKPWSLREQLRIIGKRVPRVEGPDKVTGSAKYVHDMDLPGMLHGKALRSPYPYAKIKAIDTSKAESLAGVRLVLTYQRIPEIVWWDKSLLLSDTVRFQGEEVAFVVAEEPEIAEDAIELIDVEYEQLPFVIDPEEALKDGAPNVNPQGNIYGGKPTINERGDLEGGFRQADIIIEDVYRTQPHLHNCLETHGSVAYWEDGVLNVWDSTQSIHMVRKDLAESLKLPVGRVRVIKHHMGGGFGSKFHPGKYTGLAALASKMTKRPVKAILDRIEENLSTGYRSPTVQFVKVGAKKNGELTAIFHKALMAIGAYTNWVEDPGLPWRMLYRCPNVRCEQYGVYTNTTGHAAFRAPGVVEGIFSLESVIDELAERLGMDPMDLRLKNYVDFDQPTNLPYTSKGLKEAYLIGAKKIGWKSRRSEGRVRNGKAVGIGMSSVIWFGGGGPPAYAEVKINRDGRATVITATQDIGTGIRTALAQIAAEELSLPIEKVDVVLGDTQVELYSPPSGGSGTMVSVGPAVRSAAYKAKRELLEVASQLLEAPVDILKLEDGVIKVLEKVEKSITVEEIMQKLGEFMIVGRGARGPNPDGYIVNTFGAHFAEVEVDLETGEAKVKKFVAVHESGRVVNPLTMENQILGGVVQGLGFGLMEGRVMDRDTGNVMNPTLMDYLVPTSMEMPETEGVLVEVEDKLSNSLGSKGIGEPPIVGPPAAIANAIKNAVGLRLKELPMTPDRVLSHLRKDRSLMSRLTYL